MDLSQRLGAQRRFGRASALLAAALMVSPVARATWSVVVVDTRTREVCVASATCLPNFNLKNRLAVLVVGEGGAAAQSQIDTTGQNRLRIWNGIHAGETPDQILQAVIAQDAQSHTRQYGIATMAGPAVGWTGTGAGNARRAVSGSVGDMHYAIQGNVLAGISVVEVAEQAFLATQGDMSERVMAAMEAAAAQGGDGRCSCSVGGPTSCGAPPPSFQYSSYTSFIVLARMGDTDDTTCPGGGCASGTYYLDERVISNQNGPEPIAELRVLYDAWRQGLGNRADHILSFVEPIATSLPADGRARTALRVRLRNVDGVPLPVASSTGLEVTQTSGPAVTIGQPSWHGAGPDESFGFAVTAGTQPGLATLAVTVRHGAERVRLWPDAELRIDPVTELHVGRDEVSAMQPARIPFHVTTTPADAGRPYLVLGTASGTSPGTPFGSVTLPLNTDLFFTATQMHAGGMRLPGSSGSLDADGRGYAELVVPPGMLSAWVGSRIDWATWIGGAPERVTNTTGFVVLP